MSEKTANNQQTKQTQSNKLFHSQLENLIDNLDVHLNQIGKNYGPILMEELQRRLEIIVKKFNNEIHELFNISNKKWKVTNTQITELLNKDIKKIKQ